MRGRTRRGQRAGPGRADAALPQPGPCRPRPPRPAAFRGALGTPARGREAWPRGALGARSGRGGRARLASSPWRASVCGVSGPAPEPRSLRPAHPASRLGPGPVCCAAAPQAGSPAAARLQPRVSFPFALNCVSCFAATPGAHLLGWRGAAQAPGGPGSWPWAQMEPEPPAPGWSLNSAVASQPREALEDARTGFLG